MFRIRADHRRKRSKVKAQLEDLWRKAVLWQRSDGDTTAPLALRITSMIDAPHGQHEVPLSDVVAALHMLNCFEDKVPAFAGSFHKTLLAPLVHNPALNLIEKLGQKMSTLSLEPPSASVAVKKTGSKGKKKAATQVWSVVSPADFFGKAQRMLEFAITSIFKEQDAALTSLAGEHVWSSFATTIIDGFLSKAVPSKESQVDEYRTAADATAAFEDAVFALGLAGTDSSDSVARPLSTYIGEAPVLVVNRRRQELLHTAREILCAESFNTVAVKQETERRGSLMPKDGAADAGPAAGLAESLYQLPACHISLPAQSLIELAYSTLDEVSSESPDVALMSFYGIRDVLDLFRAVVPLWRADGAEVLGEQTAAVFHNDCFYIAHHLLALGQQFRTVLPKDLGPAATFVDMVPAFHDLGERHFLRRLNIERDAVLAVFLNIGGFSRTEDDARYRSVQAGLKEAQQQLKRLAGIWRGVLPGPVYRRSIGALADVVLEECIGGIRALVDISESETYRLHDLLDRTQAQVRSLFPESNDDASILPLDECLPNLKKFSQLDMLLQAGLQEIVDKWTARELAFSAEEVRSMIKALFSNSDFRAKSLSLIK